MADRNTCWSIWARYTHRVAISNRRLLKLEAGKVGAAGLDAALTECAPAFDRLQRIMNSCQHHYDRARKELKALQAVRENQQPAPQPEEPTTTSESPASFRNTSQDPADPAPNPPPPSPINGVADLLATA